MVITHGSAVLFGRNFQSHSTSNLQFLKNGEFLDYQVSHILVDNLFFPVSPKMHEKNDQDLRVQTDYFNTTIKLYHILSSSS